MVMPDTVDFYTDISAVNDPASYFNRLRSQCPVLRETYHGALMITGYEEALEVFRNRDAFSSCITVNGPIPPLPFTPSGDDISALIAEHQPTMNWADHIVSLDGQPHAAVRAILMGVLTPSRLRKNEEYIHTLVDRLIDRFIDRGRIEFVADYANALSALVIADLLGVPEEDRDEVLALLGKPATQIEGDAQHMNMPDPLAALEPLFSRYLQDRRRSPRTDMMSDLANARFKDGTVPEVAVAVRLAKFLFGAGQDTSARLMASTLRILGECPHLQRLLRAEPHRISDFIEETLRMESPTKAIHRLARSTTSIGGVAVPAGTIVAVGLTGANRDPRHFEAPNEFNLDRPNSRDHLAFSRGAHACPGAPLARAETRITIERFLRRMEDIRICEAEHGPLSARRYHYEPTYLLRGLTALHLEFT